jgi:chromosomal replication initiator protein
MVQISQEKGQFLNLWDQVLSRLEGKVNRHTFATWFRPTTQIDWDGVRLSVHVPTPQFKDWLARNYAGLVRETLTELGHADATVAFECPATPSQPGSPERESFTATFNPKYTFDSFVVGGSNQFAHAAARAVAEIPSKSYNPLFIYGGVGLGKTHLMHAIGHYIQARSRTSLLLAYVSTDRFINEVINAIRFDRLHAFRERYRAVDVLLVDDIQFIAGKDRTQEEFFHIFNALHDNQKQIVISSDCSPRQIPTLEERLQSRFEWGLIADIQPPDIVALFIASKVRTNIRELEGSLIRLIAYASLIGHDIDLDLAREVLRDLLQAEDKPVTIEMIQKLVADRYQLRITDLKARNNSSAVAFPRQVAMYLTKNLTRASLPEIGRCFGGKHHSTVIHSVKKIEAMRRSDPDFDRVINGLLGSFQ